MIYRIICSSTKEGAFSAVLSDITTALKDSNCLFITNETDIDSIIENLNSTFYEEEFIHPFTVLHCSDVNPVQIIKDAISEDPSISKVFVNTEYAVKYSNEINAVLQDRYLVLTQEVKSK